VVTAIFTLPGTARLEAGSVTVISLAESYVDGIVTPSSATDELDVNPVPSIVTDAGVLIGPEDGWR
jgi:hypothetical protein